MARVVWQRASSTTAASSLADALEAQLLGITSPPNSRNSTRHDSSKKAGMPAQERRWGAHHQDASSSTDFARFGSGQQDLLHPAHSPLHTKKPTKEVGTTPNQLFREQPMPRDRRADQSIKHVLHQLADANGTEKLSTKVFYLQELSMAVATRKG